MGYVGLSIAVGFASRGFRVVGAETHDQKRVASINQGQPPFYERDLAPLLREVVANGSLKCTTEPSEAIPNSLVTFICAATPSNPDGSINLQYVENAARRIGEALVDLPEHHLIVVKSTVVPGTTEKTVKPIIEKYSRKTCGDDFGLCMNPEFLREGSAIHDTFHPDRIVIGEYDENSGNLLEGLYKRFLKDLNIPILRTNLATSEIIKYASNTFLAMKISFINSIASVCEKIPGSDITVVAKAIGLDQRISPAFLNAGLGYGGSCFPKDVKALIAFCKRLGCTFELFEAVENANKNQQHKAIELLKRFVPNPENKKIALLGLAFKPNTDDIREAVSVKIIEELLDEKASVVVFDPLAIENVRQMFGSRIEYAHSAIECIDRADCCIVATEWEEFSKIKQSDFVKRMKTPIVIDGRRIYDPSEFSKTLKFAAVGLGEIDSQTKR
jgi:UDPglucose 6-dehydrogenase